MMAQLLAHLWGDYLLQSDWMALNKRKANWPCSVHATLYAACFLPLLWHSIRPGHVIWPLWFIALSHFYIDRFGLARYLVWAKNWIGPAPRTETFVEAFVRWREAGRFPNHVASKADCDAVEADRQQIAGNLPWSACSATGYPPDRPIWLTTWLLIIADNTLHLTCNYIALRWL